jgi:hypothetical protein
MAVYTCAIDWEATGSMIQGIGTLLGAGAVLFGAFKAADLWKEQKRAERRLEMAERILTATHKGRNALEYVRGPMMSAHELEDAEKKIRGREDFDLDMEPEDRKKRLIVGQAYYTRRFSMRSEENALLDCLPMARSMFSEELENAIKTIKFQFGVVQSYVDIYVEVAKLKDEDLAKKIRTAMYGHAAKGEPNEISDAVAVSVAIIESICEPALRLEPVG